MLMHRLTERTGVNSPSPMIFLGCAIPAVGFFPSREMDLFFQSSKKTSLKLNTCQDDHVGFTDELGQVER